MVEATPTGHQNRVTPTTTVGGAGRRGAGKGTLYKFGFEATAGGIPRTESQDKRRRIKTCSRVQGWTQKFTEKWDSLNPTTCYVG